MPIAIEPTAAPTLEIPAPIVSSPTSSDRKADSGPSFQDHLERVNRSTDSDNDRSTSVQSPEARNDRDERSDSDLGDRAEATRRDEATDRASSTDDADSAKPKQGDTTKAGEKHGKAEAGKNQDSHDRGHEKKKESDAAGVAVVATAVVQDPTKNDEVTLTETGSEADDAAAAIAETARVAAKGTEKSEKQTPSKGRHVDPTNGVGKKEAVAKADVKVAAEAVVAKTDSKADAAQVAVEAGTAKVAEAVEPTTIAAAAAPIVSEQHSTKTQKSSDKSGAAKPEAAGKDDVVADAVVVATKNEPSADSETTTEVKGEGAPATSSEKKPGEAKSDAGGAAATFTAQLQNAVEAVATANAAAAATTTAAASDVTAKVDTVGSATTATTPTVDTATNAPATKLTNDQASQAELLRAASSNDNASTRLVGSDGERSGGLSSADRARLVQRVARAFKTAQDRGGELQIRLSPPELGQLRLQVQMTNGTLSARIEAETSHAQQVITENLNVLRDRLAEQNVRVDRIDVELMNSGSGGSPNAFDRRNDTSHDQTAPRGFGNTLRNGNGGDAATTETRAATGAASAPGRLNVVI